MGEPRNAEVILLSFGRHTAMWSAAVVSSPPAQRAMAQGALLEPAWANEAKILVAGLCQIQMLRLNVDLHPYNVIILKEDLEEFIQWLRDQVPYRQRGRVRDEQSLGQEDAMTSMPFVVQNTFVTTLSPKMLTPRNGSEVTKSTTQARSGYNAPGGYNARKWRGSVSSKASWNSVATGMQKSIEEHADEMKTAQRRRDFHGVLQSFANIKRDGLIPDAYCYNIVINMAAKLGKMEDAEMWLNRMKEDDVQPDNRTYACLMDGYLLAKNLPRAEVCMEDLKLAGLVPEQSHFNILINGCARNGEDDRATDYFDQMVSSGLHPNSHTFGALLDMYAQQGDTANAEQLLDAKIDAGFPRSKADCCMMMNAHSNAARKDDSINHIDKAYAWQDEVLRNHGPLVVTDCTPLLKACARAKCPNMAEKLFRQQIGRGIRPDLFNIKTLASAVGRSRARQLCEDLGVDIEFAKREFEAVGDEFNFDESTLNRKLWKIPGLQ